MVRDILRDRLFLFLCFIFVIISLSYPLTLTFDSGHYLFLADVLNNRDWANWDPIRGIVFPLFLNSFINFLGKNQNAFLLPMIFAQMVLFLFSVYFILNDTKIIKTYYRKIIIVLAFVVIMLDPVILGYYHSVLTEFFTATLAAISCYFAYKLYSFSDSLPAISRSLIYSFIYFLLAIPFAWHLKQPYIGTALFPFLLACFLIAIRDFKKKGVILYLSLANFLVVAFLGISIVLWAGFLRLAGMPEKPNRELTGFFNRAYERNADMALASPISFTKYVTKNYFVLSNFFYYDLKKEVIVSEPSLTRAFQNQIVASRMYEFYGRTNTFHVAEKLEPHVEDFYAVYSPPLWLNEIQKARGLTTNFLFTFTYLMIPLIFFSLVVVLIKEKTMSTLFVFICGGSSFLNALFHSIVIGPIDRYLFWGYPLNLVVLIIILVKIVQWSMVLSSKVNRSESVTNSVSH